MDMHARMLELTYFVILACIASISSELVLGNDADE